MSTSNRYVRDQDGEHDEVTVTKMTHSVLLGVADPAAVTAWVGAFLAALGYTLADGA